MLGKSLTIALGVAAGAALTALAISKDGQKTLKRLGDKAVELRNNLQKDITQVRKRSNHFI
jgi:hypothetical protein